MTTTTSDAGSWLQQAFAEQARGRALALGVLVLMSLGQVRMFDRLLYVDAEQYEFVLLGVSGVLAGTPVSKSWQQRVLPASAVWALQRIARKPLAGLQWFAGSMLVAANLVLFWIARRNGNTPGVALAIVATFALAHLLLLYKLEYPWDNLDVLIFLAFGAAAARGACLWRTWPLLLVGLFNHETILYVPLWYLLAGLAPPRNGRVRRDIWLGGVVLVLLVVAILALRTHWYIGKPNLPQQVFELETPGIQNHWHVLHNLRQWFIEDLRNLKLFISLSLGCAVLGLCSQLFRFETRRLAAWALLSLSSIVCFGYINETRHYMPLLAFYFAYFCPRTGPMSVVVGRAPHARAAATVEATPHTTGVVARSDGPDVGAPPR